MKKNINKVISLNRKDILAINDLAKRREKYAHPKWQQNSYRKGIANSAYDNYYVARLGLYGEVAVAKLLELKVDKNIYERGDLGYDFVFKNKKIDVKCQLSIPEDLVLSNKIYGEFYINATNQKGINRNYNCDVVIFCSIGEAFGFSGKDRKCISKKDFRMGGDKEAHSIDIIVHGGITISDILINREQRKNYRIDIIRKGKVPQNQGNIYNYYVKRDELRSLGEKNK